MLAEIMMIFFLALGMGFSLLAGVGILRMPDVYTRMHASTKAGTLGISCIIVAVGVHFGDAVTALQAGLVIAFLFLTAPIASHLIARSIYFYNAQDWQTGPLDEMAEVSIIDVAAKPPAEPAGDKPVEDPGDGGGSGRAPT